MEILTPTFMLLALLFLIIFLWFISIYKQKTKLQTRIQQLEQEQLKSLLQSEQLELLNKGNADLNQQYNDAKAQLDTYSIQLARLEQELSDKAEHIERLHADLNQQIKLYMQSQEENHRLTKAQTKLETEHEQAQKNNAEKLALLEDAKMKLAHEFKELANQIFEEKQHKMTASSKETLDNIIKPMQKDMSEFKARMEQVHKEDIEARSALSQHLQHLQDLNQKMSQDALNLTHALKGDSKAQGNWGEMILEKLLESSGLREGYEFKREQSLVNDEGKRQRPDAIIYMPNDKQVIIDAKVSLTNYERAVSSQDDAARAQFMRAHVKSMQQHIKTLASKRYDHLEGVHSPDYVLMFMPIEAAYLMAIEADSSIFEEAFEQRIAVVTPSTLYATLKLIEQLWRYERQTENVAKLTKQAGNLHDKFVGFIESFEDISSHITRAQTSYDKALGQLKDGRGNLVNQVKTLADLSGKAKKEIPNHLLNDNTPALPQDESKT